MTQFIPGAEHVEVPYEHPGLCPECLNLEITGRGGGQAQLLERDGKWICPRSGPSLVQQYAKEGVNPAGAVGVGLGVRVLVPKITVADPPVRSRERGSRRRTRQERQPSSPGHDS